MKLLAYFKNLINANNIAQLQKDCLQLQKLQEVLSPDKIRLFDYQEVINELIKAAAESAYDNPQLMEQLLKSNPSPLSIVSAALTAFRNNHAKQFVLLIQDKKILNIPTNARSGAIQDLARAIQLAQVELGWFQSNTNLITQSLKSSFQHDSNFLLEWVNNIPKGKMTNPLNDKQTENFKKALNTIVEPSNLVDAILSANQVTAIQNKANELIKKLIAKIKIAKQDDDNVNQNWAVDVIWYIQNKDRVTDADAIAKRNRVFELLTEHEINLDFYLDNPLNIDPSLKNGDQKCVRIHFVNACIEHVQNRDVVVNEDDWNVMNAVELAGFNNPQLFSYNEIHLNDKAPCDKVMTVFEQNPELRHLMNLIQIQNNSLLCAAIKNGNPHIHCFTEYETGLVYGNTPLLHLAVINNPAAIKPLSKLKGFDINALDSYGYTPLQYAAQYNPAALRHLLEIDNIKVNAVNKQGHTAFTLGQNYHPDLLQPLMDRADLIIDPFILFPVIKAKQLILLKQLLTKELSFTKKNADGSTPLHLAAQYFPEAISLLSQKLKRDELNARNNMHHTPLHVAVYQNPESVTELLKISDVDVNARDGNEMTPLQMSIYHNLNSAKLLLKANGVNVNAKTKAGLTALILAPSYSPPNFVDAILDCNGVDVTVTDLAGNTALHLNIKNLKIVERLLKANPNLVNTQNAVGLTPLHQAVINNPLAIPLLKSIETLDPNLQEISGNTALHFAASYPLAVVALSKLENIKVNVKNNTQWTALHFAVHHGNETAVKTLLDMDGIDVNAQTDAGETPLMFAARHQPALIELLLKDKRVKPNLKNNQGLKADAFVNQNEKAFSILRKAIKKADESFTAASLDEICKLLANHEFLRVAKEQKYSKNFLDLGKDAHFGRDLACDAFCGAINYCNAPTMLTFENWLVEQMKKVIELDVAMFNTFVTFITKNTIPNPLTVDGWEKWVAVVQLAAGAQPADALNESFDAMLKYRHPDFVEKKPVVVEVIAAPVAPVAPVAPIVVSTISATPVLSNDEIAAIKAAVTAVFEKIAKLQPVFELELIHNLKSLAQPNVITSEAASLEQNGKRIKARKWCEQSGVKEFPSLFDSYKEVVKGDLVRAPLALKLLNETVLEELNKLPAPQMAASSSSLFGESRDIFLANSSEERAFVGAPVKENEVVGQELLEMK